MKIITVPRISKDEYLYKDLKLDLTIKNTQQDSFANANFTEGSDIEAYNDENAIRNSLMNLFSCVKGEIQLMPEFGLPLYNYIGEPITMSTAQSLGEDLKDAIEKWEPRVSVENVFISPDVNNFLYNVLVILRLPKFNKELKFSGYFSTEENLKFNLSR